MANQAYILTCRRGGTGRRTGLKILRDLYSRTGSIPVAGSNAKRMFKVLNVLFFLPIFTKAIFLNNIAIYKIELIFNSDILEVT